MRTLVLIAALSLAVGPWALAAEPGASLCAARSGSGAPLSRVTLFSGNVADNAILAPDSSTTEKGVVTNTWSLGPEPTTVVCSYGPEDSAVPVLLQTSKTSCVVRYRDAPGGQVLEPIDVVCR